MEKLLHGGLHIDYNPRYNRKPTFSASEGEVPLLIAALLRKARTLKRELPAYNHAAHRPTALMWCIGQQSIETGEILILHSSEPYATASLFWAHQVRDGMHRPNDHDDDQRAAKPKFCPCCLFVPAHHVANEESVRCSVEGLEQFRGHSCKGLAYGSLWHRQFACDASKDTCSRTNGANCAGKETRASQEHA